MSDNAGELSRRQSEADRYRKSIRNSFRLKGTAPDKDWCEQMAIEMLLVMQSMKYEYHAPVRVAVRYFCDENGIDFEELEGIAMRMVADDPDKPKPV